MAKFKCVRSGNFIELQNEDDISSLRKHEDYQEVHDETANETGNEANEENETPDGRSNEGDAGNPNEDEKIKIKEVLKKRGRPSKAR